MNATKEFMASLEATLADAGRELKVDLQEVRLKASEQMAQLALSAGEPGYERLVIAARDNVVMTAGLKAVAQADRIDMRIIGVIEAGLFMGARLLAGGTSTHSGGGA